MDKNILIIAIANVLIKAMFVYGAVQCKDDRLVCILVLLSAIFVGIDYKGRPH